MGTELAPDRGHGAARLRRFGNFNISPGDWGGFGGNFRIGRMLASGDLRLVALYLIEQQPRHGYDLIKAVEESPRGFYSPSPGVVYPALTFLEEAGYVTSAPDGNKKLYTITEAGREHLNDNRDAIQSTLDFLGKAGARMGEWRERMASGLWPFGDEHHDEHPHQTHQYGWPFGGPEPSPPPPPRRPARPDRPTFRNVDRRKASTRRARS